MARLADFWKKIADGWTVQRIAAVLIVVGVVVFVAGAVNKHCACAGLPNLGDTLNDIISDFYANVSVDALSIAFAILVIDRLNERRAEQELKAQLIREMGSPDNGIALRAVEELKARVWFMDAMMKGAYLYGANLLGAFLSSFNLENAILSKANLQNANLIGANLRGATLFKANLTSATLALANLQHVQGLTEQQLVAAFSLIQTVMPDGSMYDGRYNLLGDDISTDAVELANNYRVSLEGYLAGQEWAREHLADLRREAGLDPDTGLPVEPSNGVEPQPANGIEPQPTPRRNGQRHKASIVVHRGRW
jgi:hypothetical protein